MIFNMPSLVYACALIVVSGALLLAARSDFRSFIIPNYTSAAIAAVYPASLLMLSTTSWFMGVATGMVVFAVGVILFALKWVGGGDVKLAASVAMWAGPTWFDTWVVVTSVAGALIATAMMLRPPLRALADHRVIESRFKHPMPFGIAIAIGGLSVVGCLLPLI